jgi:hypothetical protein
MMIHIAGFVFYIIDFLQFEVVLSTAFKTEFAIVPERPEVFLGDFFGLFVVRAHGVLLWVKVGGESA